MTAPRFVAKSTYRNRVAESYTAAHKAVQLAYAAVKATAPNASDYDPAKYDVAIDEHMDRLQRLHAVQTALEILAAACGYDGD